MAKKQKKQFKKTSVSVPTRASGSKRFFARIKVVGVGGGGGNAVSRMMEGNRIRGVEFIAVNTDAQDLDHASAHRKIYIGKALTHGLGTGMNPELGKQAAEENRSEIGEAIEDADIVFVTAGMGGGTGTGGGPIVAEISKEKGILTIGIVTRPFTFEGTQRATIAQDGLNRLKEKVDALVVIPNDRIFGLINKDTPMIRAFGYVDDVLQNAVKAIADLINAPGIINVDFADIKTTLRDAGATLIGIGEAFGSDRSVKAVNMAINSPLLEISIEGAKGALFSIAGGRDMKMAEIHDIAKAISSNLDPSARVIFGAYHDRSLKDKSIKVTVVATGFNGILHQKMSAPTLFVPAEFPKRENSSKEEGVKPHGDKEKKGKEEKNEEFGDGKDDQWEIPAFMRKKKK
ncbi:MAG: cell division protein FtsZ [Patescibacteria group bacterium]